MGLPSLTLNAELAMTWRKILEENGLSVRLDEVENAKLHPKTASTRVSEKPWRVGNGNADLPLIEATYRDANDGNVFLILMPGKTHAERQLRLLVQGILIASGATEGVSKTGHA